MEKHCLIGLTVVLLILFSVSVSEAAGWTTTVGAGVSIVTTPSGISACPRGARCAYFTGGSLTLAGSNNFAFGTSFSVSVWLARTGGFGNYAGVFNNGYSDATFDLRYGREDGNTRFTLIMRNPSNVGRSVPFCTGGAGCSSVSKWAHFVYVQHNGVGVAYANGAVVFTGSVAADNIVSPVNGLNNAFLMGKNANIETFEGYMDDLRIYKRNLNIAEIVSLYNGTAAEASLKSQLSLHMNFEHTADLLLSDTPSAPTHTVLLIKADSVLINATYNNPDIPVTSYTVSVCTAENVCVNKAVTSFPANITNLITGTRYFIKVAGVNAIGTGEYSNATSFATEDCYGNGVYPVVGGKCACDSGYEGALCATPPSGLCVGNESDLMTAISHPVLDTENTKFSANSLIVTLVGGYIRKLSYRSLYIEGATNANCFLGATNSYWTKTFSNCSDVLRLQMPWVNRTSCGFVNSSRDATTATYYGKVVLTYEEKLGNFSGVPILRTNQYTYDINVEFPLTLSVGLTQPIVVTANTTMDVALSGQRYNADTKVLTVEFTSVAPFPSMLVKTGLIVTSPAKVLVTENSVTNVTCTPTSGSTCVQTITVKLTLQDTSACDFDGDYSFLTTLQNCRESGGDACATSNVTVAFGLRGGSICASVSLFQKASTEMKATALLGSPSPSSFSVGDQAFFEIDIQAGQGNTFTISFVNISYTIGATAPKFLLLNSAQTSGANVTGLATVTSPRPYFSLFLAGQLFQSVGEDVPISFTANAILTFTGNQKRNLDLSWNQQAVDTTTQIRLKAPRTVSHNNNKQHNNNNNNNKIHAVSESKSEMTTKQQALLFVEWNVMGLGIVVIAVVAVVSIYKKIQQKRNQQHKYGTVALDA